MINLAWFAIRRYAIFVDGKAYNIIRDRFPVLMPWNMSYFCVIVGIKYILDWPVIFFRVAPETRKN